MADVDKLLAELTLDEKAVLTAGADNWSTVAVDRLGIPKIRVTDGPNGARGTMMGSSGATAACVPCGPALGATWDEGLIERVGALLGREARTKRCRVLLAPTVNLHRSPLAGRNFECYSEDPLLSGKMAAAFVRGVQAHGVATTVKHLAGNEAEFQRHTMSSVIDERTLREVYLVPFEMAVREGGALGIMTAYNRLNGSYCTRRPELLDGILRGEWGFEGFVLTDWYGALHTVDSGRDGLDLEMPGPARRFGPALAEAVRGGDVPEEALDAKVRRLLSAFERIGALDDPDPGPELSEDRPEDRAVCREAAAAAMVLLRNDGTLPLDSAGLRRVAVIGVNAGRIPIMGGGSASVRPHYRVTPLAAIREALGPGVDVIWEPGCDIDWATPELRADSLVTDDGVAGIDVSFYATPDLSGPVAAREVAFDTRFFWISSPAAGVPAEGFSMRARAWFTPERPGVHTFTLVQAGRARLLVGGTVLIDAMEGGPAARGDEFFGTASREVEAGIELDAGAPVELVVEYSAEGSFESHGVRVGCRAPAPPDMMDRAVAAAAAADAAIVVAGTNSDWETEGRDRESMDLPGSQAELIERVAAANPRTVVALTTGTAVAMGWADRPAAVLQAWFGGQELAGALSDVLFGRAEPGGRLPFSVPHRLEHNPSFGNFPGEDGEVRYGEGLLVGYRWYQARRLPVLFPFGHGLSYTTFELGAPVLDAAGFQAGTAARLSVDVPVLNTGARAGSEVVQCYVCPPGTGATGGSGVFRPPAELKAFAKVALGPGRSGTAHLELDDRSFAHWDPEAGRWQVAPGTYELAVGRSSGDIRHRVPVEVTSAQPGRGT